jgi:4'-phosphopantetheinyl transferase
VAHEGVDVGVDVEALRPIDDPVELAEGVFTMRERTLLRSVPRASRAEVFLALWTRKESVVKAFGMGLSQPLDAFDLSEAAVGDVRPWHGQLETAPFVVVQLDVPTGWVGAVTVTGSRISVRWMEEAAAAT